MQCGLRARPPGWIELAGELLASAEAYRAFFRATRRLAERVAMPSR
jgi:hypothetical protein